MIRKYLNSIITMTETKMFAPAVERGFIIQIEMLGEYVIFEWCEESEKIDLIPFTTNYREAQSAPKGDAHKAEEYLSVEIRNDPFGKYTGKTLADIFNAKDTRWIERCIEQMRNDYIKDRVIYLKEYFGL